MPTAIAGERSGGRRGGRDAWVIFLTMMLTSSCYWPGGDLMRWAICWVVLAAAPGLAQTPDEAKADKEFLLANYTKFEHRVPVRDGARLFTVVYAPKDTSKTYPMLLLRTPYGVGPY